MTEDGTYNGWKNRETWLVNLLIAKDQPTIHLVESFAKRVREDHPKETDEGRGRFVLGEKIEGHFRKSIAELGLPMMVDDLLTASLHRVDWDRIADGFLLLVDEETNGQTPQEAE